MSSLPAASARLSASKRSIAVVGALGAAIAGSVVLSGGHVYAATSRDVYPGQSIASVVAASAPGDTVVVHNGSYPAVVLTNLTLGGVTLVGQSRSGVVLGGLTIKGVSGLTVHGLTVANAATDTVSAVRVYGASHDVVLDSLTVLPQVYSGVDIFDRAYNVALRNSTVDGSGVTGTASTNGTARGIRINGTYNGAYAATYWPHDIQIVGNDISNAGSDLMQIVGAKNVLVQGNTLHDPQANSDHNDGVQAIGSDNLKIVANRFWAPGPNGPDQAIILGRNPTNADLVVTNSYVADNIISNWRGTGIMTAGTSDTVVVNNTSTANGTSTVPGSGMAVEMPNGFTNANLFVYNNIFDKLFLDGPATVTDASNNCIRSGYLGRNSISADPQFADTSLWRLKLTSPCLSAGTTTDMPATDYAGTARLSPPDVGAWQMTTNSPTPTPAPTFTATSSPSPTATATSCTSRTPGTCRRSSSTRPAATWC